MVGVQNALSSHGSGSIVAISRRMSTSRIFTSAEEEAMTLRKARKRRERF